MSAEPQQPEQLASPCVGTCQLDPATGWCIGCGRDAEELTHWRDFDAARRAAAWERLPERLRQLGRDCRLLPWPPAEALAGIAMAARAPSTVLVAGVEGAVAEFMAAPGSTVLTRQFGNVLELRTRGARARLVAHPALRVFEGAGRLALTLHRSRFTPMPSVITALGPDGDALDASARGQTLLDLGLGRPGFRFAVRLADPALQALARQHLGRSLFAEAPELVAALITASPTRVLLTPLGRVEIDVPIERADHEGPHTHLLPEHLVGGRMLRSGLALPDGYPAAALLLAAEAQGSCSSDRGETS